MTSTRTRPARRIVRQSLEQQPLMGIERPKGELRRTVIGFDRTGMADFRDMLVVLVPGDGVQGQFCALPDTITSIESYLCREVSVNCSDFLGSVARKVCRFCDFGTIPLPRKIP